MVELNKSGLQNSLCGSSKFYGAHSHSHHRGEAGDRVSAGWDKNQIQDHLDQGKLLDHVLPAFFASIKSSRALKKVYLQNFENSDHLKSCIANCLFSTVICRLMKMIIEIGELGEGKQLVNRKMDRTRMSVTSP